MKKKRAWNEFSMTANSQKSEKISKSECWDASTRFYTDAAVDAVLSVYNVPRLLPGEERIYPREVAGNHSQAVFPHLVGRGTRPSTIRLC